MAFAFMAERWMGDPEWIARPPKEEGLVELMVGAAKAGRTAAKVVKIVETFILTNVGERRLERKDLG